MADTGQKINYSLRLAKHIERKMLCDAFLDLAPFDRIKNYRYVGFGSFYFTDFSLFHKRLGITNMISIEGITKLETRCRENKPFKTIQLAMGSAGRILADRNFSWEPKTIMWLDYDKRLQNNQLADVGYVCTKLPSGSIILVTANARPDQDVSEQQIKQGELDRVGWMGEFLAERYIPLGLKHADLAGWGTASTYRIIIDDVINRSLGEAYGDKPEQERMRYQQLFNFHYEDGVKMMTVGGVLFKEADRDVLNQCRFDELQFVRKDGNPMLIDIPQLTYRELRYLDAHLPSGVPANITPELVPTHGIPISDIQKYAEMYRYFPTFADADI